MTIKEYFEEVFAETEEDEMDEAYDYQQEMFEICERDYDYFERWAETEGIDLNAKTEASDGHSYLVLSLWEMEMCRG